MELAKLSLCNVYRQMRDSQSSLEVFALNRLLGGVDTTPEEELSGIMAVTPADVARAAQSFVPDTVFFLNGVAEGDGEEEDDE